MRYLAIKNKDTNKLAAIILQAEDNKLYYTAATQWYTEILGVILGRTKFFIEVRKDERTVTKEEVKKTDPRYMDVLKTKIAPPYVMYAEGSIDLHKVKNPKDALEKVWKIFSPAEHQEIKEESDGLH